MNKFSKFFAAFASLALFACSSDEPLVNGGEQNPEEGPTAYLKVAIRDANSGSRASEGGYVNGNETDGKVDNAYFFFFDNDGVYVGQSSIWNGPDVPNNTKTRRGPSDGNIELKGESVIVIEKAENNTYPNYMVTVLNLSQNQLDNTFADAKLRGKTIEEFAKFNLNWTSNVVEGVEISTAGKFVMSTTSFFGTGATGTYYTVNHQDFDSKDNPRYFATKLDPTNFAEDENTAKNAKPVQVYVERLASRVTLSTPDGANPFAVDVTIAGLDNPENDRDSVASEKVYVKILAWGLNGTQPASYLSKQLTDWTATSKIGNTEWAWNDPTRFRSYWGKSMQYGDPNIVLNFTSFNAIKDNKLGEANPLYCNENTNLKDAADATAPYSGLGNGAAPNHQRLTTVLVKARVYKDKDCSQALDLVEHNGLWFTEDAFRAYIMGVVKTNYKQFYTRTESGNADQKYIYNGLTIDNVEFAGDNDRVYLVYKGPEVPLYIPNDKFTDGKTEDQYNTTTIEEFNNQLKVASKYSVENVVTRMANGGDMFYTIPIEHLNTLTKDSWVEGSYGVVRNHAYNIKVNSIKRLGQGVYKPQDNIIPSEDNKTPEWYLGATINVLSWHIVNQNVDL